MTVKNSVTNDLTWASSAIGQRQSSRRATLLSGTALVAGVAAGILFTPAGALAACNFGIGATTNACSGTTTTTAGSPSWAFVWSNVNGRDRTPTVIINTGAVVDGRGIGANGSILDINATVTNNGSVTSNVSGVNGTDVKAATIAGVGGSANYSGAGSVTGAATGLNLDGLNATVNATGGTIKGNGGDGIKANALVNANVSLTNTIVSGMANGLNLSGNLSASATVSGGSVTGTNGNGINASSLGNVNVNLINGAVVTGGQDGLHLNTSLGIVAATVNGSSVTGTNGNGITAVSTVSQANANLNGATVSGGVDGVSLNGSLGATATVNGGTVTGGTGNSITATSLLGSASANLNGATVSGGKDGVNLTGGTGATATVIGGTVTGTSGNGITASSVLNVAATLDGAIVSGGKDGVNLTGGSGATATVIGGKVTGMSGNGITATSGLDAKAIFDGARVVGAVDGVNLSGGTGAIIHANNSDVTGGANGLNLNSTTVNVELDSGAVTGNGGDGIKSIAAGLPLIGGGTTIIDIDGTVITGSQNGINAMTIGGGVNASTHIITNGSSITGTDGSGISAITLAATVGTTQNASTKVEGSANITGGSIGILAGAGSLNGDANAIVDVSGNVTGDNVGVVAVAGSVGGDPAGLLDLISDPTNIANLANLVAGNGKATVNVTTTGVVTADNGVGIVAIGLGTSNDVDVDAQNDVISANGIGILAGSVGVSGTVDVRAKNVTGGIAGIIGFNTDGDTNVTAIGDVTFGSLIGVGAIALNGGNAVATLEAGGKVSSNGGLIGVGALSDGGNATVNIKGEIDPPLIGGISVAIGNGTALSTSSGSIDADLLGVVALNIGNGRAVIDSSSPLQSSTGTGLVGLAGIKVGDANIDGLPDVEIINTGPIKGYQFGITGVATGNGNHVDINSNGTIDAGLVGISGVITGDDGTIDVKNSGKLSTEIAGISGVVTGTNGDILVDNQGNIVSGLVGISGVITGDDGTIDVKNSGKLSTEIAGISGVVTGTNGDILVDNQGNIETDGVGISAVVTGANGNIYIDNSKTITAGLVGISGVAAGDSSNVNILTSGEIIAGALGVSGFVYGQDGTVNITTDANVTSSGIGVLGSASGKNSDVSIITHDGVSGNLLGIGGIIGGENSSLIITTEETVTSASGVGIASASEGDRNTVIINANDSVSGNEAGVLALTIGDLTTVQITTKGTVDATDGVGILATTFGNDGTLDIATEGAVIATASGVIGTNSGGSTDIQIGDTITVAAGGEFGAFAQGGGTGFANIDVNGAISGAKTGATALTIGSGDAIVTSNALVTASELGLGGSNFGTGNVLLTNNAAIQSDGSGIAALKVGASGSVSVDVHADISGLSGAATGGDGVLVISSTTGLGAVDVNLDDGVSIKSEENGINAIKLTGDGVVTIAMGEASTIEAGFFGIHAANFLGNGDVIVDTGKDSSITAGVGIVATRGAGTGDVGVNLGADSMINGYVGVAANNLADDGNVQVMLNEGATILATRMGIEAGSLGDVAVTAGADTSIVAEHGQAIMALASGQVNITTAGLVLGEGEDTTAVVSLYSGEGAYYHNQAGGIVASVDLEETKLAIDAKGAAINVINDGILRGRVNLTAQDDVLNNNSSHSWYVSGLSDFGAGTDLLVNTGKIRTSFDGAGGEYAEFRNLEHFINGDVSGVEAGLLTMQGETQGLVAYDGLRDITITGGDYTGVGNAGLALDVYLGQSGSTSDVLQVEGSTAGKTLVDVRDMNSGPGAYNPIGITFADVWGGAGSADNFAIDPATANAIRAGRNVIDKGMFFYDVALVDMAPAGFSTRAAFGMDHQQFRFIGVPDHEAFELPVLVSGAQNIWHETSGVWLDRQADLRNQLGTTETLPEGYVSKDGAISAPKTNGNVTPGVWAKAVGSWTDRDNEANFSIYNNSYSYDTSYKQNTFGVMAGIDFGNEDVYTSGDALIFGVMAGYVTSDLDFKASNTSADYSGATIGAYGTYLNNGFFVDALLKADLLKMDYSAPSIAVNEKADVNTYGFTLDTGYRFDLENKLFLEPVATLAYARTSMDDLASVPGAYIMFPKNDSLRGSLGVRFGGEIANTADYKLEASVTGRVWNEFKGNNYADVHSGGLVLPVSDDFKGAFGEVGGILNMHATSNNWSGFVSGSYKFNGDFKSGSVRGGVRLQW